MRMKYRRCYLVTSIREMLIDAMDTLGLALANSGHTWTPKERKSYEVAIRILTNGCGRS